MEEFYLIIAPDIKGKTICLEDKNYMNTLFKNSNNVFNIPNTFEDIIKSFYWFDNRPYFVLLVSSLAPNKTQFGYDYYSYLIWDIINEPAENLRYGTLISLTDNELILLNQYNNSSKILFNNYPNNMHGKLIASSHATDFPKGIDISVLNKIINKEEIKSIEVNNQKYNINKIIYL